LPQYPWNDPPYLTGVIEWWDLDPLDPIGASGYVHLDKTSSEPRYYGEAQGYIPKVAAEVWFTGTGNLWQVNAILLWEGRPPIVWPFTDVYVDPDEPFDSQLLSDVVIPLQDYRRARILN